MQIQAVKKRQIDWFPYLMLLPTIIFLAGITAYPFFTSISLSFFDYSFLKQGMNFVGLKNYIDVFTEGKFLSSLGFTFSWTVVNVALMTLLGFAVALLMRHKFVGREIIKGTMLIPWILPQVVTGFVFNLMLSTDIGVVNYILQAMGVMQQGFSWFASPLGAAAAVLMANVWRGFPFVALMIYAKMQSIPSSYVEAATIDGANGPQCFCHILLPFVRPVTATCMLLTFLWSFNAFDIIKVMTNGGPLEKTMTLSLRLQREAFSYLEISRACTMAVIMFFLLIACIGAFFLGRVLVRKAVRA